jgi:uncharacterized protein
MAADGNADVSFLVSLAGTGVLGREVLVSQQRANAAADGTPTSQLDKSEAINRRLYDCFFATSDSVELERQLRAVLTAAGIKGESQNATVAGLMTPWERYFITYDPTLVLRRTRIPVLALNGTLDLQVLVDLNLPPIQQALLDAGNTSATIVRLDGLNHLFQHATTGSPNEYGDIAETMAPEVLNQVTAWIQDR